MVVVFLAIGDSQKCLISKSVEKLQVYLVFSFRKKLQGIFLSGCNSLVFCAFDQFHLGKLHYIRHIIPWFFIVVRAGNENLHWRDSQFRPHKANDLFSDLPRFLSKLIYDKCHKTISHAFLHHPQSS